jgi:hypothetical protein
VGDIAVDRKGDLFVPGGTSGNTITVFAGPGLCGPKVASIADPYGDPVVPAADPNSVSEKIVVGTDDTTFSSSVSVCTLSDGCTSNLTNPNISNVAGVAIARNGDCWGVGLGRYPSTQPSLVYFAHCQGHGVLASGFQNQFGGKVDIDDNGNLISLSSPGGAISDSYSLLYIYSGCNPACTLVRRPFPLFGVSDSFHLDGRSKRFVAADIQYNQLDVYSYSTNSIEYKYSINNGLSPGGFVAGAAFSPESKE